MVKKIIIMVLIFVGAQFIAPNGKGVMNHAPTGVHAASNPVALWHMDENPASDSTTISDSAGSNNGTLYTNDGTNNKATAGKVGGAISFDGVDDRVTVFDSSSLDITSAITLEAWAKITSRGAHSTIISKYLTSHTYWLQLTTDDNYLRTYFAGLAQPELDDNTTLLALNTWYHLVSTYDGSYIRLWVNGVNVKSVASTGTIATNNDPVQISGYSSGSQMWDGLIDEVAIYNRALDSTEIYEDYKNGMGIWPFSVDSSYTYDTSKIEITGGVARLKDLGITLKDDTIIEYNSSFTAGDTTRGYTNTASGPDVSLVLDTVGVSQYAPTGTFTSRIFDTASGCGNWQRINASVTNGDIANSDSLFDSGLVGLWHLNENTGTTAYDASGNGNNGTLAVAPATPTWTTSSKLGAACLSFDGGDYISVGSPVPASLQVSTAVTLEAWIKPSATTGYGDNLFQIVGCQYDAGGCAGCTIFIDGRYVSAGQIHFQIGSGVWHAVENPAGGNAPALNEWTHIAAVWSSGNQGRVYFNGVLDDAIYQNAWSGSVKYTAGQEFSIGRQNDIGRYFRGLIDEVAIWNRALDSTEIADHYNSGSGKELHRAAKFQVRSGDTVGELAGCGFAGSRGDSTSYYNGTNENLVSCANFDTSHRYAQYKAYLNASTDSTRTPTVASVALVGSTGNVFDNTKGDFDLGTYSTTDTSPVSLHSPLSTLHSSLVGLSKMPNGGYNSYGSYTSHVFDAGVPGPNWQPLVWTVGGTEIDASENGLVGLWHMNGDWKDAVGNNNGTTGGSATWDTTNKKLGSACGSFDSATNDYVQIGQDKFESDNQGTIEVWIKRSTASKDYDEIFSVSNASAGQNLMEFGVHGSSGYNLYFQHYMVGWNELVYGNTVIGTSWRHVVVTSNGSAWALYVDGNPESLTMLVGSNSGRWFVDIDAGTHDVRIGRRQRTVDDFYFSGLIDEVAIYNRALSASEVMNHYQNANPGTIKFQCRADSTAAGLSAKTFTGPDSTSATFYETSGQSLGIQFDGKRYLQYRAYFE